jgi:undecaprenyl pyrophosphate phosphatase UppP
MKLNLTFHSKPKKYVEGLTEFLPQSTQANMDMPKSSRNITLTSLNLWPILSRMSILSKKVVTVMKRYCL